MRRTPEGWGSGLLGVTIFSGSLRATRVAAGGFRPVFLTSARAVIAALLGAALLVALREKRPSIADVGPLIIVATGVVVGFPLLTALALRHITSAQLHRIHRPPSACDRDLRSSSRRRKAEARLLVVLDHRGSDRRGLPGIDGAFVDAAGSRSRSSRVSRRGLRRPL